MDNIRSVIEVLYLRLNGEEILCNFFSTFSPRISISNIDKSVFRRILSHSDNSYTLDQSDNVYNLLSTKWMNYSFSNGSSIASTIFNVLLHFTNKVLTQVSGNPVAKFESLMRWHEMNAIVGEDLLTTSYLAFTDIESHKIRTSFCWDICINNDNRTMNVILEKPMCDLHNHMKGSSCNFELNWLSLMNHISGRKKEFDNALFKFRQEPNVNFNWTSKKHMNSLYANAVKSALIRSYLFSYLRGIDYALEDKIVKYLLSNSDIELCDMASRLQSQVIDVLRISFGMLYNKDVAIEQVQLESKSRDNVDYAIQKNTTCSGFNRHKSDNYINTILSGERWLMYSLFRETFSNKLPIKMTVLFYAYLLMKNRFRHELVQLNKCVGFENFNLYEKRKLQFVPEGSVYDRIVAKYCVDSVTNVGNNNYIETRIVPKNTSLSCKKQIEQICKDINSSEFGKHRGEDNYRFIYHFIKSKDVTPITPLFPRHHLLRKDIKEKAFAIYKSRNFPKNSLEKVVGIDAANSEVLTRPEVFAHAFRFLRKHNIKPDINGNILPDLGITYHVGEDYLSVVDGLRAVDEVLKFMQFGDGDRLGHALVLGVDVEKYYKMRHNTVALSKQILLDNIVWLSVKVEEIGDKYNILPKLKRLYETYYRDIFNYYLNDATPSIWTYYQSWQLRGDSPYCYKSAKVKPLGVDSLSEWYSKQLNNSEEVKNARNNEDAVTLYYLYHYDERVKNRGSVAEEIKLSPEIVLTIKDVQKTLLDLIEKLHIAIECNPTSNYKIGEFCKYDEHPITRFYNYGLNCKYPEKAITVSINTDDKGVFSTSLQREYSLLALAMEKTDSQNSPRDVIEWLDKIREMGQEQRFNMNN